MSRTSRRFIPIIKDGKHSNNILILLDYLNFDETFDVSRLFSFPNNNTVMSFSDTVVLYMRTISTFSGVPLNQNGRGGGV